MTRGYRILTAWAVLAATLPLVWGTTAGGVVWVACAGALGALTAVHLTEKV